MRRCKLGLAKMEQETDGVLFLFMYVPSFLLLLLLFSSSSSNNNTNKYISRALNLSVSNLLEAESVVHVQLSEQTTYSIKTKQIEKSAT